MHRFLILCGALLAAGCSVNGNQDRFLAKFADPTPSLEAVLVCHGYGCTLQDTVDLRAAWPRLVAVMTEPAPDAATERDHIALALGAIEHEVGALTGTSGDLGGTFGGFAQEGQLDCIDEASNTTTYLTLMDDAGLLHWHEIRGPMSRFFVYDGWPHTSAVIVERATGQAYAVDSWFRDNGEPAAVVPLEDWVAGWSPEDGTVATAALEGDDIPDTEAVGNVASDVVETVMIESPSEAAEAAVTPFVFRTDVAHPAAFWPDPARPPRTP